MCVPGTQKGEDFEHPGTEATDCCELSCECWKSLERASGFNHGAILQSPSTIDNDISGYNLFCHF